MTPARSLRARQKAMPVIGCLHVASPGPFSPYMDAFPPGANRNRLRRGTKPGDRVALGGGSA